MDNIYIKNKMTSHELQLLASEMDAKKKSTVTTYLLWLFLGGLGGHRYYLGKYGTAMLMTLTLGCFGIWTIIDLFLIGSMLKKKNSEIESEIISKIQLLKQDSNEHIVKTETTKDINTYSTTATDVKENTNINTNIDVKPQINTFSFRVAGISMENDEGKDIQEALQKYAKKYCIENDIELFGGYTNKEILDDPFLSDGVNEFYDLNFNNNQVIFVPEPDNQYDKNAIKIYLDFDFDKLHIGYVPKKLTKELMDIINNKNIISFDGKIIGGNIKEMILDYNTDKYKIEKKELTLGFEIDIQYRN